PVADLRVVRDPQHGARVPDIALGGSFLWQGRGRALQATASGTVAALYPVWRGDRSLSAPGVRAAASFARRAARHVARDGAHLFAVAKPWRTAARGRRRLLATPPAHLFEPLLLHRLPAGADLRVAILGPAAKELCRGDG